jgi:CDP-diacylglycerol--glycerol-3-phosphate 3-phosphatidyltransferase
MRDIGVVTLAERPTRVVVVVVGLLLAGAVGLVAPALRPATAAATVAVWAALALVGFGQLLATVRRALR